MRYAASRPLQKLFGSAGFTKELYIKRISSTEYRIYAKKRAEERWVYYLLERRTGTNQDIWMINGSGFCDFNDNPNAETQKNTTVLVQNGVWDYAIGEGGSWVGSSHGREIYTFEQLLSDGKPVSLSNNEAVKANQVSFFQKSELLKGSDSSVLATGKKEYIFTAEGFKCRFTLNFEQGFSTSTAYAGMCSFVRDSNLITHGRYINDDVVQDIEEEGFDIRRVDDYGAFVWHEDNKVGADFRLLNPAEALNGYEDNGSLQTYFQNTFYNKFYCARIGKSTSVEPGEVWNLEYEFKSWMQAN